MSDGCGAPVQSGDLSGVDTQGQTVLAGKTIGGAYVRLLNADGDFTGEVQASQEGDFRFYAAPGKWIVRSLHRTGNGEASVTAEGPGLHEVALSAAS
jgi:hypothetical protein